MSNKDITTISDELYAPFNDIDSRRGRGGVYDYIKWQSIIDRMNKVFGLCWSSYVVSEKVTNESVVLRVGVSVYVKELDKVIMHEGYGGASIMSGMEPATAQKSAYSKALKDALKKLGIGLHIEDGAGSKDDPTPVYNAPVNTNSNPINPPMYSPTPGTPSNEPMAPSSTPVTGTPSNVVSTPVVNTSPATPSVPTPSVPSMPNGNKMANNLGMPLTPQMPSNTNGGAPTLKTNDGAMDPNAESSITNVQEMAIRNLARLKGVESDSLNDFLATLINNEECILNREVSSLDKLSYNEAVSVIKTTKHL